MNSVLIQTPVLPPAADPSPAVLGRYRLGRKLATGGMATVYLAVANDSAYVARPLALKRIHPHLASEKAFVEMFIDEARIASRLHHPNLCGVLDFGEADGSYFMTMEYLIGEPLSRVASMLARRAERGSPAGFARVAAQIVSDACEGLHSAHELRDENGEALNIVHRDVTPSNVFVTYEGPTRVVDFGIASAADCVHHTSTGTIRGKFGYMSPDHFNGERPDRRADIWALGVVLWETIALRPLFRRDNPSLTMMATLEGHVPPLHEVVAGVDPALSQIAARALAKKREDRYQTAAEMAADLQHYLASHGAPSARAEVAALVKELYPTGEDEKRLLIKTVMDGRRSTPPRDSEPADGRASASQVVAKGWLARQARGLRVQRLWAPVSVGLSALIAGGSLLWAMRQRPALAPPLPIAPIVTVPIAVPRGEPLLAPGEPLRLGELDPAPPRNEPGTAPLEPEKARSAEPSAERERREQRATAEPPQEAPGARVEIQRNDEARGNDARTAAAKLEARESRREARRESGRAEEARRTAQGRASSGSSHRHSRRREAAETAAAAAAAATGLVSVTTTGDWAEIYHEGNLLGPTPGRFSLPEGRQVLSLKPGGGGAPRTLVVVVQANETVRVRADL